MSIDPDVETWPLSEHARAQMEACGIALSELYRLLHKPVMTLPAIEGNAVRVNGYGLTAVVLGRQVLQVAIDGANGVNWSDWAVERAEFGDGDVEGADAMVREHLQRLKSGFFGRRRWKPAPKPEALPLQRTHILDRVHPALREQVTQAVEGDFSRLVIITPTKVTILPKLA